MLDKRLTREVSDLLELSVADDKIVRILLVRGFTTEQIKRAIKEIRDKTGKPEIKERRSNPVSETIEAAPGKRFSFVQDMFGGKTEAESLEDETKKIEQEEQAMKVEEAKMTNVLAAAMNAPQQDSVPHDVKRMLKLMDSLLAKLPRDQIDSFAKSKDFALYKRVMEKYVN
jgi:uncharacterized protein YceH (UPF0502 family)